MNLVTGKSKIFVALIVLGTILSLLTVPLVCAVLLSTRSLVVPQVFKRSRRSHDDAQPLSPFLPSFASRAPPVPFA